MMGFLRKVVAAIMILTLASQCGCATINEAIETNGDSLVTKIVTKGTVERLDQLMVLKSYEHEMFMTCMGDIEAHEYFLLFFINKFKKAIPLLILKVESCGEESEGKIRQSVILKSYDSDLTNVEVMVRVKNEGCERYTSVDKRMSPCKCGDTQDRHDWTKLSIVESLGVLQDILEGAESRHPSTQPDTVATSLTSVLPGNLRIMEKQEIVEAMAETQLKPTSTNVEVEVRRRRGAGRVILEIIMIPICIIAFIVTAAVLIPVGIVVGAVSGAGYGIYKAGKATGVLLKEAFKNN